MRKHLVIIAVVGGIALIAIVLAIAGIFMLSLTSPSPGNGLQNSNTPPRSTPKATPSNAATPSNVATPSRTPPVN